MTGRSPVVITVSRIRRELQRAAGAPDAAAAGERANALLGRLFHETFAALMSSSESDDSAQPAGRGERKSHSADSPRPRESVARESDAGAQAAGRGVQRMTDSADLSVSRESVARESNATWRRALLPDDLNEPGKIREHVYLKLVGPRLAQYSAALQASGKETLSFWRAVSDMCEWTRAMLATARDKGLIAYDPAAEEWRGAPQLVAVEQELEWDISRRGWSRPVRVVGVADAVWRKRDSGEFCVVEYKTGRTSPESDLCQACLYREMLSAGGESKGSLAVLRFLPELNETFYRAEALAGVRETLLQLIGKLAGVVDGASPEITTSSAEAPPAMSPEHEALGRALLQVLVEFGSPARIEGRPIAGPTFLRFVLEPEKRVRTASILRQADDLQVRLRLDAAPIIHVDRGRLVVDLQRKDRQIVYFSSIRDQIPATDGSALVPVGVDLAGRLQFADLSNAVNAHILVAGTSGSGKSEWLRSALAGLILANSPTTLRLVLIDPKRNAFTDLKGSPYLYGAGSIVYPPDDSAVDTLEMLIEEMEARYRDFEKHEADDLDRYIRKTGDRKPRIVCVCDEYADLVSANRTARRDIEAAISRLGAKARAAGIHLIIATQRPSRDIVAGALKANMSCKVALKTQSAIESRLILEESGAENLLGHGDLLFADIGKPARLQSPYLTEEDRVASFRRR